jgi:hypothetical protein
MHRWINFQSTQTGGSLFESTGGSELESVKDGTRLNEKMLDIHPPEKDRIL